MLSLDDVGLDSNEHTKDDLTPQCTHPQQYCKPPYTRDAVLLSKPAPPPPLHHIHITHHTGVSNLERILWLKQHCPPCQSAWAWVVA